MTHFVLDARTATPHFPGIGRYVRNLARAMGPELAPGERLTVLVPPDASLDVPASGGVQVLPVDVSPFSVRQQWALPRILRELSASLYHSAYYLMPYLPPVPTVVTVYDLIPMLFPAQSTLRARTFFRWATALALRSAEHVIAISETTTRDVVKWFGAVDDAITAIPLAVAPAFEPQTSLSVAELRRRYDLPERSVLYLGSNKPHKNLVRLVEAWAMARSRFPDHVLVIAGAWVDANPQAMRRAAQLDLGPNAVLWLGPVEGSDLPALYAAATLFIFPSLYEGFGLPPLEAMACGTPVACSAIPALQEVTADAAYVFDPLSVTSIANAISEMLGNDGLQRDLRHRGLERAASFSWRRTAVDTLRLYRDVLAREKGCGYAG